MLQPVKVSKLRLNISQLFLQPPLHWRARLQAVPPQPQKPSNLAQSEPQTLHPTYKSQRLNVGFRVSPEAAFRPGWVREQTIALVKTNRVHAESDLLRDDSNLHCIGSSRNATPWSIVQSQPLSFRARRRANCPRVVREWS